MAYRAPSELEGAFLRVVTRGYPNLEVQIASCEIGDDNPVGFVEIRARSGPPQPSELGYVNGPDLLSADPDDAPVQTILFVGEAGMLYLIEFVQYRSERSDLYRAFVEASLFTPHSLFYRGPDRSPPLPSFLSNAAT